MIVSETPHIRMINADCMEVMAGMEDNAYELAVVDPPFGIGDNWNKDRTAIFYGHKNDFNDSTPEDNYFSELLRVSKDQIIWGCNYYWDQLEPTNNLIFWDKKKDAMTQHGSAGELAWTSITKYPLNKVELIWNGAVKCEYTVKVHPHQKPILLYKWLLKNYATEGDRILDTHGGSMSIAIACYDLGFDLDVYEIDGDYYKSAVKRFKEHKSQKQLFRPTNNKKETIQGKLL